MSANPKPSEQAEELAKAIKAMSPAAQLRLAADLLEKRTVAAIGTAHAIVQVVATELGGALLYQDMIDKGLVPKPPAGVTPR